MSESDDDVMGPTDVAEPAEEPMPGVEGEVPGEASESSGRSIMGMLTSTEPDVSPREASGAFDPSVPWHKDLEAGLQKITGSGGMPAIGHVLVAVCKLGMGQDVSLSSIRGGNDDGGGEPEPGPEPDVITGDEL